jgi:L-asparaginase
MDRITLISTGGTLEKTYSEQAGGVHNKESKVEQYLRQLRLPDLTVETIRLMNKDSLEMTDGDREFILAAVRQHETGAKGIVITHGTDTLVETGKVLAAGVPNLTIPVILTGAMTPLGFEGSDGLQNLTESLLAARLLPAGVYLVIHSQVFPIHDVYKDRELARFRRLSSAQPPPASA